MLAGNHALQNNYRHGLYHAAMNFGMNLCEYIASILSTGEKNCKRSGFVCIL